MAHDESPHPAWITLPLSLVAGLGHLVLGRPRRGLALFLGASAAWNLAALSIVAPVAPLSARTAQFGIGVGGALTIFAMIDVFRLGIYGRLPAVHRRRSELFEAAVDHYLRREYREARRKFDRLLDLDPADPVTRLYLATLERRAGSPEQAIHHARKALGAAPHHPFHPEIEREIVLARQERANRRSGSHQRKA